LGSDSEVNIQVNLDDAYTMLKKRGLEPNGDVQQKFTNECARKMDAYVPMSAGAGAHMKNPPLRVIEKDRIIFNTPYARFQYYGKVMIGIYSRSPWAMSGERKIVTNRDLTYHGAPMRGKMWDKRMWADKKTVIIDNVAKAAGGKAK
jgi:hypothetical protein